MNKEKKQKIVNLKDQKGDLDFNNYNYYLCKRKMTFEPLKGLMFSNKDHIVIKDLKNGWIEAYVDPKEKTYRKLVTELEVQKPYILENGDYYKLWYERTKDNIINY